MFIYREEYYEKESERPGEADIIVAKHRNGPFGEIVLTFQREYARFMNYAGDRFAAGRGLWFMGPVGTGKTTLAMLVSKAALRAGRSVAIYSLPRLLNEIRDTHRAERSHVELLDRLIAVDLLHIDDVGAERTTDWVLEELYSIVNGRYEDQQSIVITTNILDREALCEQITERTVSRLTEMCDELPLLGDDHRMDLRST